MYVFLLTSILIEIKIAFSFFFKLLNNANPPVVSANVANAVGWILFDFIRINCLQFIHFVLPFLCVMSAITILFQLSIFNHLSYVYFMIHYFTRIIAVQKPRENVDTRISK